MSSVPKVKEGENEDEQAQHSQQNLVTCEHGHDDDQTNTNDDDDENNEINSDNLFGEILFDYLLIEYKNIIRQMYFTIDQKQKLEKKFQRNQLKGDVLDKFNEYLDSMTK